MMKKKLVIKNPSGLHMRPAGIFIRCLDPFESEVSFCVRENSYNARSMLNILSAAVKCGDEIELVVNGEDEAECLNTVVSAIENGLGEWPARC